MSTVEAASRAYRERILREAVERELSPPRKPMADQDNRPVSKSWLKIAQHGLLSSPDRGRSQLIDALLAA